MGIRKKGSDPISQFGRAFGNIITDVAPTILNTLVPGAGGLLSGAITSAKATSQPPVQMSDKTRPTPGIMSTPTGYRHGGMLKAYNAPTHENGGQMIDQNANPTNNPNKAVGEIEKKETSWNGYVFSDTLGEGKKTFAQMSKEIVNRYKGKRDSLSKKTMERELMLLIQKNEAARLEKEQMEMQQIQNQFTEEELATLQNPQSPSKEELDRLFAQQQQQQQGQPSQEEMMMMQQMQQQGAPQDMGQYRWGGNMDIPMYRYQDGGGLNDIDSKMMGQQQIVTNTALPKDSVPTNVYQQAVKGFFEAVAPQIYNKDCNCYEPQQNQLQQSPYANYPFQNVAGVPQEMNMQQATMKQPKTPKMPKQPNVPTINLQNTNQQFDSKGGLVYQNGGMLEVPEAPLDEYKKGGWIQKVTKSIKKRGTEGVCTGDKFGGPSCPPGSKRYNLAKTFRAMAKKEDGGYIDSLPDISLAKYPNGGQLPQDYEQFLAYNKTMPENLRADIGNSSKNWQYGNPKQYDYYGLWHSLGKPRDFNHARELNPDWKEEEDGYYHGFSVNPHTGVLLKPVDHPTTWMENAAFNLGAAGDFNPNTQALIFDPQIGRLRYIPRDEKGNLIQHKDGGTIQKYPDGGIIDGYAVDGAPTTGRPYQLPDWMRDARWPYRIEEKDKRDEVIKNFYYSIMDDVKDPQAAKWYLKDLNQSYGTGMYKKEDNIDIGDYFGFDYNDINDKDLDRWTNEYMEQRGFNKKPTSGEYKNGGMIKRADGSYSKRGLWDNIRDNIGSGKKPTKEMLEQERKIKAQEYRDGGYVVTRSNERKGKTHKVTGPDGTVKFFGDPDLKNNPSEKARDAFYARHKKNLEGNPHFRAYARATWRDGGMIPEYADGGIPPGVPSIYSAAPSINEIAKAGEILEAQRLYEENDPNDLVWKQMVKDEYQKAFPPLPYQQRMPVRVPERSFTPMTQVGRPVPPPPNPMQQMLGSVVKGAANMVAQNYPLPEITRGKGIEQTPQEYLIQESEINQPQNTAQSPYYMKKAADVLGINNFDIPVPPARNMPLNLEYNQQPSQQAAAPNNLTNIVDQMLQADHKAYLQENMPGAIKDVTQLPPGAFNPYKDKPAPTTPEEDPFKLRPLEYATIGLKGLALGKSIYDALQPADKEQLRLNREAGLVNNMMAGRNVNMAAALNEALYNRNAALASNQARSANVQRALDMQTYSNTERNAIRSKLEEQNMNNQLRMQEAQVRAELGAAEAAERVRRQNVQSMNEAARRQFGQKAFQDLSTIGTELNKAQVYKDMYKNKKNMSYMQFKEMTSALNEATGGKWNIAKATPELWKAMQDGTMNFDQYLEFMKS